MFEGLKLMDSVRLNFSEGGLLLLNFTLFFIMFGVALEIKVKHLKNVFLKPKAVLVGVVSQFLVLPSLTFLFVWALGPNITLGVAMGLILVAACPGGNISNFMSTLAGGNAALSVTLTAIATLSATFMTPLNFSFWGNLYSSASQLAVPLEINPMDMFKTVLLLLGIPITLGMIVNYKYEAFTKKITKPMKIISIVIFVAYVVIAFAKNLDHFLAYIQYIFLLVLIHNIVAFAAGYFMGTSFKVGRKNRRTITIETGIQNSGLALVLIFNPKIFPPELEVGGMAIIAAWWGVWHILSGLTVASLWSKRKLPEDA